MNRDRFFRFALGLALAVTAGAASPKPGSPAPGFTLPELLRGQNSVSLKSLAGKVVVVDFWASWCPPCRKSLPQLARMRLRHPSMVVLAVSVDEDKSKAKEFLTSKLDTALIFLHDAKKSAAADYDLGGMPSLYVIDKQGRLRFRHDGYSERDMKAIEPEIEQLMGEP
jgi:thiol-disulfide isomerase/thioredoxin